MIGGFTRHVSGANGEGTAEGLLHKLRYFLAWTIVEACDRINDGRHGLNPPFNPNFGRDSGRTGAPVAGVPMAVCR